VNTAVATFNNPNPADTAAAYTATISWGDGSTSPGTITANGSGGFTVTGSHTYADPHGYTVTVTISNVLGYATTATVTSTATVSTLGTGLNDVQTMGSWFWHSYWGQTLINSFNGGSTATALGNWLASTFPNVYGATAGSHNLTGRTNAQVAAFFQTLWAQHGDNTDVEVLATALDVYATTSSLGGTAAQAYGFRVTPEGFGAEFFIVAKDGAAFGVANGSVVTVSQLLAAVNQQAVNGALFAGHTSYLDPAEDQLEQVNQTQYNQAGDIGFWHGNNGQALINSFNGGPTSTALANWLASSFPNLYGTKAGADNLTGKTNTQVAAFFQSLWALHHDNADVQVLATALNVYATTFSLGGTAGVAYGFLVTAEGLGAASVSVGWDGAAFGVANGTTLNVYELLAAVNQQAVNGVLFAANGQLSDKAEDLFEQINESGQGCGD
jgi:hypothetical protein